MVLLLPKPMPDEEPQVLQNFPESPQSDEATLAMQDPLHGLPAHVKKYIDTALIQHQLQLSHENNKLQEQYLRKIDGCINHAEYRLSKYTREWENRADEWDKNAERMLQEQKNTSAEKYDAAIRGRLRLTDVVLRARKDSFKIQIGLLERKVLEVDLYTKEALGLTKKEVMQVIQHTRSIGTAAQEKMEQQIKEFDNLLQASGAAMERLVARISKVEPCPRRRRTAGTRKTFKKRNRNVSKTESNPSSMSSLASAVINTSAQSTHEEGDEWVDVNEDGNTGVSADSCIAELPRTSDGLPDWRRCFEA